MSNLAENKQVIILCGPTASGKSEIALELAHEINGAVINADSIQVYQGLPLITASPTDANKIEIAHYLYNFLKPDAKYSVMNYINDVEVALQECTSKNLVPIIVGGTGMYINALMKGVAEVPEINKQCREEIIQIIDEKGSAYLHSELEKIDPLMAGKLHKGDTQRVMRAYEVIKYTGKSLLEYQKNNSRPLLSDFEITTIYLKPEREFLYRCCNNRFKKIVNNGGIEEVKNLMATYPDLHDGVMKALGAKEISLYLQGILSLPEAIKVAQARTRQYAKRQVTWFNHQLSWLHEILTYHNSEEFYSNKIEIIKKLI